MIKSFFIICCFSLFLVATVFIAGGLDHSKCKKQGIEPLRSDVNIPLNFSKITGIQKPECKPYQTYISKR